MRCFTIGYGGRKPADLIAALAAREIRMIVDVRLRPDRASMGFYSKANSPEKGIQALLAKNGIEYVSLIECGNPFMDCEDWQARYSALIERAGDLITDRLGRIPPGFCLMCAEKRASDCHRQVLAQYLTSQGWKVEHIE